MRKESGQKQHHGLEAIALERVPHGLGASLESLPLKCECPTE